MIAGLALVIFLVIAGAYVFLQSHPVTGSVTPAPTPTPLGTVSIPATITTAPQLTPIIISMVTTPPAAASTVDVPSTGVWVKVTYSGSFTGAVGTPGSLRDVVDAGTHVYQISTSDGPVVVTIQKVDGSSAELAVDVYKNGDLMKHSSTTTPKGIVEIQASIKSTATTNVTGTSWEPFPFFQAGFMRTWNDHISARQKIERWSSWHWPLHQEIKIVSGIHGRHLSLLPIRLKTPADSNGQQQDFSQYFVLDRLLVRFRCGSQGLFPQSFTEYDPVSLVHWIMPRYLHLQFRVVLV
jgi:hypothetical protein